MTATTTAQPRPTVPEDNSHAGQGAVVVDIGGDYGALVLDARPEMDGVEVEIRPVGDTPFADEPHEHGLSGGHHHLQHVAVLRRPSPSAARYAAVFPSLHRGTYELYRRPADPVALTVEVVGAVVTEATWPQHR